MGPGKLEPGRFVMVGVASCGYSGAVCRSAWRGMMEAGRVRTKPGIPMDWMDEIASESVLNQAYAWLCERRLDYSPNDDVWDVRWRWEELRRRLQDSLRAGTYRIGSVRRFSTGDETIEVWPALDALVLKATAIVLAAHWVPDSRRTAITWKDVAGPRPRSGSWTTHLASQCVRLPQPT